MVDCGELQYLNSGFIPGEPGRRASPKDGAPYKIPKDGRERPSFIWASTPGLRARMRGMKDMPALPYNQE